jgi:hypothetical protein
MRRLLNPLAAWFSAAAIAAAQTASNGPASWRGTAHQVIGLNGSIRGRPHPAATSRDRGEDRWQPRRGANRNRGHAGGDRVRRAQVAGDRATSAVLAAAVRTTTEQRHARRFTVQVPGGFRWSRNQPTDRSTPRDCRATRRDNRQRLGQRRDDRTAKETSVNGSINATCMRNGRRAAGNHDRQRRSDPVAAGSPTPRVRLSTVSGGIRSDFPLQLERPDPNTPRACSRPAASARRHDRERRDYVAAKLAGLGACCIPP